MPEARSNVDMGIIDPMQQQHMDNPPAYAVHHQQQPIIEAHIVLQDAAASAANVAVITPNEAVVESNIQAAPTPTTIQAESATNSTIYPGK